MNARRTEVERETLPYPTTADMETTPLRLQGLVLIQLVVRQDERGFFIERFHRLQFATRQLPSHFVQDNHSRSLPRVLRGLHYQHTPPQGKLVGVTRGRIWDVAVDIRPHSRTYGQSVGVELSAENGRMLWIPPGFAHGFCVMGYEPADLVYKADTYYNREGEGGIFWADATLAISWPTNDPIVSARDGALPSFAAYRARPAAFAEPRAGGTAHQGDAIDKATQEVTAR